MSTPWVMRTLRGVFVPTLAFFLCLIAGCLGSNSSPVFDSETSAALQASLDSSRSYLGMPGAVVFIKAPDGSTWQGVSGFSEILSLSESAAAGNLNTWIGTPIQPGLHFRIGSCTKPFTATVILQLAGEEQLTLEDTVAYWLGDVVPRADEITVRQLLNMTSGLADYVHEDFFVDLIHDPLVVYTPEELINLSNEKENNELVFPPETEWAYCNTNYILLGLIIEKVTGNSYREEVRARIIDRLKMTKTLVPESDYVNMPEPYAHGYVFPEESYDDYLDLSIQNASAAWSAGCIISTASELVPWVESLVGGTLLEEEYYDEMFTWTSTSDQGKEFEYYGLGVINFRGAVGHAGSIGGYRSCTLGCKGYSFVVLLNGYPTITPYAEHSALYVYSRMAEILGLIC